MVYGWSSRLTSCTSLGTRCWKLWMDPMPRNQSGQRQQRDKVDDNTQAARLAVKCPKQYVSSAVSPQRGMSLLLMPYSHAVSTIAITVMLTGVYHSHVPIQNISFRMCAIVANSARFTWSSLSSPVSSTILVGVPALSTLRLGLKKPKPAMPLPLASSRALVPRAVV